MNIYSVESKSAKACQGDYRKRSHVPTAHTQYQKETHSEKTQTSLSRPKLFDETADTSGGEESRERRGRAPGRLCDRLTAGHVSPPRASAKALLVAVPG